MLIRREGSVGIHSGQTKRAVPAFVLELDIRKEYILARSQINAGSESELIIAHGQYLAGV